MQKIVFMRHSELDYSLLFMLYVIYPTHLSYKYTSNHAKRCEIKQGECYDV